MYGKTKNIYNVFVLHGMWKNFLMDERQHYDRSRQLDKTIVLTKPKSDRRMLWHSSALFITIHKDRIS